MQKTSPVEEKKTIRIFMKGNDDITDSLLSLQYGGQKITRGLHELIDEKYHGAFSIEVIREPFGHSDLIIQQLGIVPEELLQMELDNKENFITTQFKSRLFEEHVNVVVFSIQPDITHLLWKHRQKGYLFYPHTNWEEKWTSKQKQWLQENFFPVEFIQVQQFKDNFIKIIRAIKEGLKAHVIMYNCSSFDPEDKQSNYYKLHDDTLAVRIQKFNLALMNISVLEGISIIDVDRLIAELGGGRHVLQCLSYSNEAYHAICQEFQRILEDIGFFENRPLIPQIGQKEG